MLITRAYIPHYYTSEPYDHCYDHTENTAYASIDGAIAELTAYGYTQDPDNPDVYLHPYDDVDYVRVYAEIDELILKY